MRQESARRIWLMLKKEPVHGLSMEASAAWGSARQSFSVPSPSFGGVHRKSPTPAREPLELAVQYCAGRKGPEERWLAVGRKRFAAGKADLAKATKVQAQQRASQASVQRRRAEILPICRRCLGCSNSPPITARSPRIPGRDYPPMRRQIL